MNAGAAHHRCPRAGPRPVRTRARPPRDELSTPALLLDMATLHANLDLMAAGMRDVATTLRAHVKVHKSPHIARMQVEHGAIGVGCATVWEAIVMARAGIATSS